jgi:hypothetical protein
MIPFSIGLRGKIVEVSNMADLLVGQLRVSGDVDRHVGVDGFSYNGTQ